jgi:oligopeptidase B
VPAPAPASPSPSPPVARRVPKITTIHGRTLVDDYDWLRNKGSPDVLAYLDAENAYTAAMTKPMQPLVDALYAEMLGRVQETDATYPVRKGDWLYYARTEQGKQYPIECRRHVPAPGGADAPEQVLVDLNEIATHEPFVGLGDLAVSDDGDTLAYTIDTTGFRQLTLHVKDLRAGRDLPDHAERVDSIAFARDPRVLFYVTEDATTKRANQLRRHAIGEDTAKDPLVYEEKDERFELEVERTRSKEFVVVTSASHTTTEVRLIPAGDPQAAPRVVAPREADHEYYVDHAGAQLFIRTNSGGRNFRLVSAPVADPSRARWKEIVPHRADTMLEEASAFADHVVLRERHDAKVTLRSIDTKTGASHAIAIDEPAYALLEEPNLEFDASAYRFAYETPAAARVVLEEDVRTGARAVLKRTPMPGFDPARYQVERVAATARDGTAVPVSLLHRRDVRADGTHPMFLYAYGSYGHSRDPEFKTELVSLADRGVVVALAHIRGGGDLGKAWHDAGRMKNKRTTFTDFIDSAEWLVKSGWAKKDAIAIHGRSAGGLLMGAVTNMRPDLWRAVFAGVPFVDVINTMLDESVPLTVGEFEEWGNPKIPEQFGWMIQYSPYDNVAKKAYPAMLVETSYNDSQVMYFEPAKWVAKLRANKTDTNPLLLRVNMKPAGHWGLSGRYDHLRELAFEYAWVLTQLGAAR